MPYGIPRPYQGGIGNFSHRKVSFYFYVLLLFDACHISEFTLKYSETRRIFSYYKQNGLWVLCQKAVVDEGCEYLVAGFESAGEGAGDFGGADAFSVADGDFADGD